MADNIMFKEWQCHNGKHVLTREDSIKRVMAFAGIHDLSVNSEIDEQFGSSLANWNTDDAEATWAIDTSKLKGTGDGAAQWYKFVHNTELNLGWVVTFDKFDNRGGFICCSDNAYDGYIIWWDTNHLAIEDMDSTSLTELSHIDCTLAGDATITVSATPLRLTDVDTTDDIAISVWWDGQHLLTHTSAFNSTKGKKIGFAVYQADEITFDNLYVPQLHQPMEWTSVDPGELAAAGFSRVTRQGSIMVRARYNGSVRIWRCGAPAADWVVPSGRFRQQQQVRQVYTPSHYRLVGAKHEVDNFRAGNQGHIFELGQDPNALSEDEVTERSSRMHKDIEEESNMFQLIGPPNPAVEPEDILTLDGTDRRVSNVNFGITWRGDRDSGAPVLESTIALREEIT